MKKKLELRLSANVLFLVLVLIFSVGYTYSAFAIPFGTVRSPGASFIPRIVGVMAVIISAILLAEDLRKKPSGEDAEKAAYPLRVLWFIVAFIGYVLIFQPVGYVISTVLFTFVLCMVMGNKWWVSAAIGLGTGVAFYILFTLLSVPLPLGVLTGLKLL